MAVLLIKHEMKTLCTTFALVTPSVANSQNLLIWTVITFVLIIKELTNLCHNLGLAVGPY